MGYHFSCGHSSAVECVQRRAVLIRGCHLIRSLGTGIALIAILLTGASHPSPAAASGPCNQINRYAQQRTSLGYIGLFGWLTTYDPAVPNFRTQFSVDHLYVFNDGGAHVEVGWYKGYGSQVNTSTTSYFSSSEDALTQYEEHDYSAAAAGAHEYETRWLRYDRGLGRDLWAVWAQDLNTAKDTWPLLNFPQGYALSGGEVSVKPGYFYSQLEMHARISPSHQLQISDTTWHDWTVATMAQFGDTTTDCEDTDYALQWFVQYDDLLASGTAP